MRRRTRTRRRRRAASSKDSLVRDLKQEVQDIKEAAAIEDTDYDFGPAFTDEKFVTEPDRIRRILGDLPYGGGYPDVLFLYDGDAYDFFGDNAMYPRNAVERRERLSEIARKHGFHAEPYDNVTLAFYDESSSRHSSLSLPDHLTKRTSSRRRRYGGKMSSTGREIVYDTADAVGLSVSDSSFREAGWLIMCYDVPDVGGRTVSIEAEVVGSPSMGSAHTWEVTAAVHDAEEAAGPFRSILDEDSVTEKSSAAWAVVDVAVPMVEDLLRRWS